MAKRYHQSHKDRVHERVAEMKHDRRERENSRSEHAEDMRKYDREHGAYTDKMDYRDTHHRGMKHSSPNGAYQEEYANLDMRRRREMEDSGYITEDHSAIANLPQNVMMKPYPYAGATMPSPLDDTIEGVDKQMHKDSPLRHLHPWKF